MYPSGRQIINQTLKTMNTIIQIKGLSAAYDGKPVLHQVDLNVYGEAG